MFTSKPLRYTLFALLYFSQGAIMAYFTAFNALYLRSFGIPMARIGLIASIALIPFVLKIFLGMLSDRVNLLKMGHRKPYILIGLIVQAGMLLLVPSIDPGRQFGLFAAAAFLLMTGMALYDTSTDGLALDTTPIEEQGAIQGFMVGGRAMGVIVVSATLGLLADNYSWTAVFIALAVLGLLPIPLVLKVSEASRPAGRKFEWGAFKAFANRSILALGALGAVYSLVINGAVQIFTPFLESSYGISYTNAGALTMVWGIGVVLGGLSGGRLVDWIGQHKALLVAIGISFLTVLALAAVVSPGLAWPLFAVFGLAFGYYETVYFAMAMRSTDPRIAASMFSILMAVANIGTGIGLAASGALTDAVGFRWTFVILALINLLALGLSPVIFRRTAEAASMPAEAS